MNRNLFETTWKPLRGHLKSWWGKLADEDLERVGGNFDQLMRLVQANYGCSRKRAEEDFYWRMAMLREMRVHLTTEQQQAQFEPS